MPAERAYAPSVRRGLCAFSVSGEPPGAHHPAQIPRFLLPGFAGLTSGKRASAEEIPIKKAFHVPFDSHFEDFLGVNPAPVRAWASACGLAENAVLHCFLEN